MDKKNIKLSKVVDYLNETGLEGLIIYSNGSFHFLQPALLQYFAGWRPMGPHNAAIVSKTGDVILIIQPKWDKERANRQSWIKDVRGTSDFMTDIQDVMKRFNFSGSIGMAGTKEAPIDIYNTILNFGEVVVADEIIENIAMEKTPSEVDRARKAGKIADAGFNAFVEHSRPGIREYELVAEMEYAMRTAGADDNFNLISSGKHNYSMHPAYDRRLAWGDIVISEISPVFEGQVVQLCRTLVLGKVSSVLKEKYDMLLDALKKSQEQIKPGIPASAMSIAMNKVISDAGYEKYCKPPYMRARGHGFSLGSISPGATIDNNTKQNFQKNQLVVVHPNQYLPETGYLACGESVLVNDTGFERVSETDTKLYSKGA